MRIWHIPPALLFTLAVGTASTQILPSMPSASTRAALEATPSTAYEAVLRIGFATVGDAPPLMYISSAAACSLNGGAGDGGSEVRASDGNCWLAVIPQSGMDIREWGAKGDGSTDNAASLTNALAWSSTNTGTLLWPSVGVYKSNSQLTLSSGGAIRGSINPGNPPTGSTLACEKSVTICLRQGGSTQSSSVDGLIITVPGGSGGTGRGLYVIDAYNVVDDNIMIEGFADCLYLHDDGAAAGGISFHSTNLSTGACSHAHMTINGWPEVKLSHVRMGMNGAGDVAGADSYFLFTGGFSGTAGGPNTFECVLCQANAGGTGLDPAYWLHFTDIPSDIDMGEFAITTSVVNCNGNMAALIAVDASVSSSLKQFNIGDLTANCLGVRGIIYNSSQPTIDWDIHDSHWYLNGAPGWSFPAVANKNFRFHHDYLNVGGAGCRAVTVPGAPGSVADFSGTQYDGCQAMILSGAWRSFTDYGGDIPWTLSGASGNIALDNAVAGRLYRSE